MDLIVLFFFLICLPFSIDSIRLEENCGRTSIKSLSKSSNFECKIVGGNLSRLGEWPWQVFINKTIDYDHGMIETQMGCGASILNEDWLLTAAHCVNDFRTSLDTSIDIKAIFNSVDLFNETGDEIIRDVVKVIVHEDFQFERMINDIALVKLNASLDFHNGNLSPICIPKLETEFFQNCFATGFGFQDKEQLINDYKLRSVPEKVYNFSDCRMIFENVNEKSNVCLIDGLDGGHGTCRGDSGSPMQCYHSNEKRWYQMALVSYGEPCALPNIPDVFTRVSYFYDWIVRQKEN